MIRLIHAVLNFSNFQEVLELQWDVTKIFKLNIMTQSFKLKGFILAICSEILSVQHWPNPSIIEPIKQVVIKSGCALLLNSLLIKLQVLKRKR